jgi:hypothetical protein
MRRFFRLFLGLRLEIVVGCRYRKLDSDVWKCCNFENGDGGGPERNWAARFQAARSNSWSMN